MRETKPFASLSSGLLARKGMAKPAMRPQGFGHFGGMEDLGWNDMGRTAPALTPEPEAAPLPERKPSSIAALTPGPVVDAETPPVVEQQRDLAERFTAPQPVAPAVEKPAPAPVSAQEVQLPRSRVSGSKAKAAFTLRLQPDRHLRLRLACAVTGRSAQMLVTEALDSYLDTLTELDGVSISGQPH